MDTNFRQNIETSRFEWQQEGHIAFANYSVVGNILYVKYVEAPPALRGTGAASKLMEQIAQYAEKNELKIQPICSYAVSWIQKHTEYHSLLAV